jgi:ribosomal protein L34E
MVRWAGVELPRLFSLKLREHFRTDTAGHELHGVKNERFSRIRVIWKEEKRIKRLNRSNGHLQGLGSSSISIEITPKLVHNPL